MIINNVKTGFSIINGLLLETRLRIGKCSVGRLVASCGNDFRKAAGRDWRRRTAYVQPWAETGWQRC